MGGEVESPRVVITPGVEELPREDGNSGVTLEGNGVPGVDGWGRGGVGNSPSTRETKGRNKTSHKGEMANGQDPEAPLSTQRGTKEEERGEVITQGHPDGANGAKLEHDMLARCEYILLVPEELTGDPAAR